MVEVGGVGSGAGVRERVRRRVKLSKDSVGSAQYQKSMITIHFQFVRSLSVLTGSLSNPKN